MCSGIPLEPSAGVAHRTTPARVVGKGEYYCARGAVEAAELVSGLFTTSLTTLMLFFVSEKSYKLLFYQAPHHGRISNSLYLAVPGGQGRLRGYPADRYGGLTPKLLSGSTRWILSLGWPPQSRSRGSTTFP